MGNRDDLGRDGADVAADVAGGVRVIGVDVRLFVLDAFRLIRARHVGAFVPVVRTVLAPIAVAVFMRGRRHGADVAADVAGRIRVIGVDMRRFVLDAFFSIRARRVGTFVPVVRTVLAPVAVAVLMRGRGHGADIAADVTGRIRVIGVDVRRFVLDAFGLFRAVRIGTFVPVIRTVLAPIAVAVLMRGRRGIAGNGDLADRGFARTVRRSGGDRRGTCLDRRHGAVRGYGGNILVRGRPSQSLDGGVLRRDRGGQRFAVSNRNRSFRLVKRDLGNRDDLGRHGADVAADVAGRISIIVVDVRRFVLDAFGLIRARRVGTFVPVVRTVLAPVAVAVLMRGRRGIAGNGDLADRGFARTVRRSGGDRRGTCLDRRHGAVRGYGGNILVRGRPSQSLDGGVLRRDRGGQRFAVSNRNRSFRLVKRDLGNRDDLGRHGADVAADVTGRVRIIGVDVRLCILDAFFPIRAVIIRAFVPVVRTVLAPIAVAVLVRGRRHGERCGLGVYGRRAHAVTARMVVRVPEHTAEQLAALCRRDGRDRIAGNVVPIVLLMTDAAGAFDVRPVLAAVGAALPLILQRVEILIDQLGGECHRITRSRGHALRLLRDHGRDAHVQPPETGHGLDRIVGIGQRDMEANTLIVHLIRDGDGIGFARGWDRSPLLFRWHNVSAVLPAVFRCDARQRAYGIPGTIVV